MNQAACTLEETVSRGGTDLVKVLSEGKSVDDVRYSVLLTRSLDGDGDEFDKIRFVYVGDGSKFEEVQYTAEGEALFEVNDDLVQAVDVEARSPDGSDSITASFTFDC